jgi:hypothetical protein
MRLTAMVVAAIAMTSCGARAPSPLTVERKLEGEGLPPATVRVMLQREHEAQSKRFLDAASESIRLLALWSLADDLRDVTLVDPPWHETPSVGAPAITLPFTPWWTTPTSMVPEMAVARRLTHHALTSSFDTSALPPWFVSGFSEYIARQIVLGLFQHDNNSPGFAFYEARHFGGLVPRFVRIRLLPESDGKPLDSYRRHPDADVASHLGVDQDSLFAKTALTIVSLDRWVSRPVFDAVIVEFVRQFHGGRPTLNDFGRVASAVSGQDLSWLFVQTLGGSAVFDYALADIASVPASDGRFETRVTVARHGDGLFTGATAPRVGRFESGRGLTLLVSFADGTEIRDAWDGRDDRKTFTYRGPVRAISAVIDPDRLVALDLHRTNNSRTLEPRTAVASRRWAARWASWLQHLLLTYGALV